jgi:O-antigen ligase
MCGIAIFITGGRIAGVAYITTFLLWLYFRKDENITYRSRREISKVIAVVLAVLIGLGGFIGYRAGKINTVDPHRVEVWKLSIDMWKRATITGFGHGSFKMMFQPIAPLHIQRDGHWAQAHNEYIQILFEHGIIGLGIILSLMWITLCRFWKRKKGLVPLLSLATLAIIATYGFPLRTAMGLIPLVALVLFEREQ